MSNKLPYSNEIALPPRKQEGNKGDGKIILLIKCISYTKALEHLDPFPSKPITKHRRLNPSMAALAAAVPFLPYALQTPYSNAPADRACQVVCMLLH